MRKSLLPVAAVLAWSVALAALSGFDAMDADRDGAVSEQEHANAVAAMFKSMDADGDGRVTAAEMHAAQEKVTGKPAGAGELSAEEKIRVVDGDGDGVLTRDEHGDASRALFGKMDSDRSGSLSPAEFEAGHVALQKQ
jgi:Ca2+-binding EF-hand superfamily protein